MKFTLPNLKLGERVQAKIVEVVSDNEFIANFHGDLLRISNKTKRPMQIGQVITLEVTSLKPFLFKLAEEKRFCHIDFSV
jgi:hypothetical protein